MPPERRMTDAEMRRKTNKPIMEKKRRERINNCLEDLKSIVLKSVSEDSRPNKLEKADILEMTVRYLKSVQTTKPLAIDLSTSRNEDSSSLAAANDDSDSGVDQRRAGYDQCMRDVAAYLSHSQEGISPGVSTQLLVHLTNRCNSAVEAPRPVKRKRSHPAQQVQPFPKRLITELDLRRRAQGRVAMDDSAASFGNVTSYLAADVSSSTQNLSLAASPPGALHTASPFSPVPVSPISNPSTVSPGSYRQIASPSLSSSSQDSIGDAAHGAPDSLLPPCPNPGSLFSPVTPVVERKPRFLMDSAQYHYVSSDSGHWSSGSNPPSPISKMERVSANNNGAPRVLSKGVTIKVENSQQGGMWRPWGL